MKRGGHTAYLHEGFEVGVLLLEVVVSLTPLRHCGAMPHHHREVAVQQQHPVRHDRGHIQHDRLWLPAVHTVGLHGWLYHEDGVSGRLPIQQHSAVGSLIWAVAKHLPNNNKSQRACLAHCSSTKQHQQCVYTSGSLYSQYREGGLDACPPGQQCLNSLSVVLTVAKHVSRSK